MTAMPEAKLAREAELCYATVAMVTDFDCWHPEHDAVMVSVIKVVKANAGRAKAWWRAVSHDLPASTSLPDRVRPGARQGTDHRAAARDPELVKTRCGGRTDLGNSCP